jgi:alpha-L-arabinofuranosidase
MAKKAILSVVVLAGMAPWLPVCAGAEGRGASITVQVGRPGAKISPALWGIFFEDLNFAADGGLYAELVKNRSFEFPDPMMGWKTISVGDMAGAAEIRDSDPFNAASPHYLRLEAGGISNEGFRGMGIRAAEGYVFSCQVRAAEGRPALRVVLAAADGQPLAEARLGDFSSRWGSHTVTLGAGRTEAKAHLEVRLEGRGGVDLDMVSLFPEKTWRGRAGGLRPDLVQMLADLRPGFIKFPGGFLTEGRRLDERYLWKQTLGDVAERKPGLSPWSRFPGRPAPDYFQSYGLGFFEYLQLAEDLGAEPLAMLNCGMAAQFTGEMAPLDQLEPYAQDALDLIEFANGPATSPWGSRRAGMGHPSPFNLKMIRLGNETIGPQFIERYERIAQAVKARYPGIQVAAGSGPDPAGKDFDFLWDQCRKLNAEVVDEHSHSQPAWFFGNAHRYDSYDRNGPKVIFAEHAAHSEPGLISQKNRSTLWCALSEAAFYTGLERNADVVIRSCYACLLAHVDAWQWVPNLIWFDNLRVYGTPSYYVQQIFSTNRGDRVLPLELRGLDSLRARAEGTDREAGRIEPLYACAAMDETAGEVVLKVVNPLAGPVDAEVQLEDVSQVAENATALILTSASRDDENSFGEPVKVAPQTLSVKLEGPRFRRAFPAYSLTILRIKISRK